jgi:hypothetical protein
MALALNGQRGGSKTPCRWLCTGGIHNPDFSVFDVAHVGCGAVATVRQFLLGYALSFSGFFHSLANQYRVKIMFFHSNSSIHSVYDSYYNRSPFITELSDNSTLDLEVHVAGNFFDVLHHNQFCHFKPLNDLALVIFP